MRRLFSFVLLALVVAGPATAQLPAPGPSGYADELRDFGVPPQDIVHQGPPHAPTPLSIPGARVMTTAELYAALTVRQPIVLLYVLDGPGVIAGSHWLFGAGGGSGFDDRIQSRLQQKLAELTGGNHDAMIVTYCLNSHCWLSYNTALRAARMGYPNVYWYRGGKEAWKAAGLPLVQVAQEAW